MEATSKQRPVAGQRSTQQRVETPVPAIPVANTFDVLPEEGELMETNDNARRSSAVAGSSTVETRVPAKEKVPPFFIKNKVGQSSKTMVPSINTILKYDEFTLCNGKKAFSPMRLETFTIKAFKRSQKLLNERKYHYWTHELEGEKQFKVVLAGLTSEYSVEEVMFELNQREELVVKATKVVRLTNPGLKKETQRKEALDKGE